MIPKKIMYPVTIICIIFMFYVIVFNQELAYPGILVGIIAFLTLGFRDKSGEDNANYHD